MASEIFTFAVFPNYNGSIRFLANLAENEQWDFSDSQSGSYPILSNYLNYTFKKLKEESNIFYTSDNQYACFNTGLTTDNLEDIYAFFEKYRRPTSTTTPPYCFKAFLRKSERDLLSYCGSILPDTANYFTHPENLIFNPKYEIITDIDHIINDNISRFPTSLQNDNRHLRIIVNGAIDEVKKRVRNNYKIAIAQYYRNNIQLLLPLHLTVGSPNPDLAIAVYKDDHKYIARTCLTLKMAYNNARLIVRPQSEWLRP